MASPSPFDGAGGAASYAITFGGKQIDQTLALLSVTITRSRGRASVARIALSDGDPATGGFSLGERGEFAPGVALSISLGYGESLTEVFSGRIVGQGLQGQANAPGQFIVEASDRRAGVMVSDVLSPGAEPVMTLTWGESILDLDLDREGSGGVGGRVTVQGSALPASGGAVTLVGVGSGFDGRADVVGLRHLVADGLWTTELDLHVPPPAAGPHHVGRLVLNVAGAGSEQARAIGERLERLADGALATALEQAFDHFGLKDRRLRLERLDLNLGTVRPDQLEGDVMAALARVLPEALKLALVGRLDG